MKNCIRKMHRRWKGCGLAVCVILLLAGAWGCGKNDADAEKEQRYIAVICKGAQHEFWKTVEQGAKDAGEELNIKITFEAPENESQIDVQIDMMEKAIENNADAIVLAPLDTEQLNPVIEKATAKNIPVLTFDSDVTSKSRVATIGSNNISAGAIAARNAADMIGGSGKVAIVSYVKGVQTAVEREGGFLKEIEENYKGRIEVVGTEYCNGDAAIAKQKAMDFVKKYPDLKCIYGTNEGSAVGIADAIAELGLKDKITVIGFDSSDAEIDYLKDEVIDGMMVQNPYNMGYLGVRNINKVLDGKTIEEKIDTGVTYVNKANLYDEDTQWLLYPLGKEEE